MPDNLGPDFLSSEQEVNIYWGNQHYAIYIGKTPMRRAMTLADEWFKENDHFFYLEHFPPYRRFLHHESYIMVDYGSYSNFLYCIPV